MKYHGWVIWHPYGHVLPKLWNITLPCVYSNSMIWHPYGRVICGCHVEYQNYGTPKLCITNKAGVISPSRVGVISPSHVVVIYKVSLPQQVTPKLWNTKTLYYHNYGIPKQWYDTHMDGWYDKVLVFHSFGNTKFWYSIVLVIQSFGNTKTIIQRFGIP